MLLSLDLRLQKGNPFGKVACLHSLVSCMGAHPLWAYSCTQYKRVKMDGMEYNVAYFGPQG